MPGDEAGGVSQKSQECPLGGSPHRAPAGCWDQGTGLNIYKKRLGLWSKPLLVQTVENLPAR